MKAKIIRMLISLLLVSTLIINLTSMSFETVNVNKISNKLLNLMSQNDGKLPVSIWLESPNISEEQQETQMALTLLYKDTELAAASSITRANRSANIKKNYRETVSQMYLTKNEKFAETYLNIESITFISKYAPMIIANLTNSEIIALSGKDNVVSLCYYEEPKLDTLEPTPINVNTRNYLTSFYTAEGVNIGVFDGGIPSETVMAELNVIATNGEYNGWHADSVTNVLKEIAPDANYYFTGNVQGYSTAQQYIEWLLDFGVDIINMSIAYSGDGTNAYGHFTRWFDHIAYNHYVLLVKSAGNSTTPAITSPGMAYNIITVGALDETANGWVLDEQSCYYTGNTLASKPDIVAMSENATSCAAPVVTATAALLMHTDPFLAYAPETLKAILAASVDTTTDYHYTPNNRVDGDIVTYMQAGAGVLNIDNALEVGRNGQFVSSFLSTSQTELTYTLVITAADVGSTVRISMAHCVPVGIGQDHLNIATQYPVPNIDLYIYGPYAITPTWNSTVEQSNVEIVEFTPSIAGTYTIKVSTTTETTDGKNVYFGLAWSIQ